MKLFAKSSFIKLSILLFIIGTLACDKEDELYTEYTSKTEISNVIAFTKVPDGKLSADSVSSTRFEIKIASNADSAYRRILVTTDKGRFSNKNDSIFVQVDATGYGQFDLISGTEIGPSTIQAKIKDIIIDTVITFSPSYPEDFLMETSHYVVDSNNTPVIKVKTFKNTGIITPNTRVHYIIKRNDSASTYPIIPPYSVIKNDSTQVEIKNPFDAQGEFVVEAKIAVNEEDSLSKTVILKFN